MRNICAFFEENDRDVYSGRSIDLDPWFNIKSNWGFDELHIINLTDAALPQSREGLLMWDNFGQYLDYVEGETRIRAECPWQRDVKAQNADLFDWPDDFVLEFGPAAGWASTDVPRPEKVVYVNQNGSNPCHSVHIANVLAYLSWR